jgi:Cation transporter/ATPase, N-terminus
MPGQTNPYETKSIIDVLTELKVQPATGLSDDEVKQRQTTYGLNEVVEKRQLLVLLFMKHFWGLTAFMLEFTIVISFLLHKYVDVYLIGGLRIGLLGIASNIIDKTMPPSYSEGIYFTIGKDELPPIIDVLRVQEKVDLIVLVSHLGFAQDMKLLSDVHGIDICLSGHTHNRLHKRFSMGKLL